MVYDVDKVDTVVVPAREDGFQAVFLGENRWYAIKAEPSTLERMKYIAAYRVAPVSAITHMASIRSFEIWQEYEDREKVEPWLQGTRYVVNFAGPARKIGPIVFVRGGRVK